MSLYELDSDGLCTLCALDERGCFAAVTEAGLAGVRLLRLDQAFAFAGTVRAVYPVYSVSAGGIVRVHVLHARLICRWI